MRTYGGPLTSFKLLMNVKCARLGEATSLEGMMDDAYNGVAAEEWNASRQHVHWGRWSGKIGSRAGAWCVGKVAGS